MAVFGYEYCRAGVVVQVAETYAFLPREAVTKFLMSCADCQKRMHLTMDSLGTVHARTPAPGTDHDTVSCDVTTNARPSE